MLCVSLRAERTAGRRLTRLNPGKDGNQYGDVLVLDAGLEGFVTNKGWPYVKGAPDIYPIWMPIPELPKPYLEGEQ